MTTLEDVVLVHLAAARLLSDTLAELMPSAEARGRWSTAVEAVYEKLEAVEDEDGQSLAIALFLDCLRIA